MSAMELLSQQHREVEGLFEKLKTAQGGQKIALLGRLAESLTLHATLEERHFYPLLRQSGLEAVVSKSLADHADARRMVSEILELKRSDPRLDQTIARLESSVSAHVREEEGQLFPQARERCDAAALDRAGEEMRRAMGALENEELPAP